MFKYCMHAHGASVVGRHLIITSTRSTLSSIHLQGTKHKWARKTQVGSQNTGGLAKHRWAHKTQVVLVKRIIAVVGIKQ